MQHLRILTQSSLLAASVPVEQFFRFGATRASPFGLD
jgi:hypothetical protein